MEPTEHELNDQIERLVKEINSEISRHRRRFYAWLSLSAVAVVVAHFISEGDRSGSVSLLAVAVLIAPLLVAILSALPSKRLRQASSILAACDKPAAVGSLIDMTGHILPRRTARAISAARHRALRQVKASDRPLFADRHHHYFRIALTDYRLAHASNKMAENCESVLLALLQVGDDRAIPAVRRIVAQTPRNPEQVRLHNLAVECLEALEEREKVSAESQKLLRPAYATGQESQVLMRAAVQNAGGEQNLLHIVEESV